ncbi:MAG: hypothetical protein HRT74_05815 [Flavobacteriales bacterium]|nr:hypothetical protein [Flavobacteriales bacterium]
MANWEDGSCTIEGCQDPEADNYNPDANVQVDCIYLGCTDEFANNYDPGANENDGSCIYNEAFFSINSTGGCAPFELVLYNQTSVVDNGICTWFVNGENPLISCLDSVIITLDSPGDYSVTYQYEVGEFTSEYIIEDISVFEIPDIPVISFEDGTNTLSCTNCSGSLQWYQDGEPIDVDTPVSWVPTDNAFYSLEVTNDNGCSEISEEIYVLITSIDEAEFSYSQLFPNPADGHVQLTSFQKISDVKEEWCLKSMWTVLK